MAICGHCAQCAGLLWPSVLVCSVWPWWPCGHAGNGDCVPPCHRSLRSSRQPALSSGTQPAEPPASWQYTAQPPLCVFVEMVKLAVQKKVCNGTLSPLVAAAGWQNDAVTRAVQILCKYSLQQSCNAMWRVDSRQCLGSHRSHDQRGILGSYNTLSVSGSAGVMRPSMAHKWSYIDLSEHRSFAMWTGVTWGSLLLLFYKSCNSSSWPHDSHSVADQSIKNPCMTFTFIIIMLPTMYSACVNIVIIVHMTPPSVNVGG